MAKIVGKPIVRTVGKELITKTRSEENSMPITRDQLAWALCNHAQMLDYDHGDHPTIEWNVGACPRHIGMAHELFETIKKEAAKRYEKDV